jgi:aspartate aminotransferase
VVVTCGAKHALFSTLMAILNPGDEVLIPTPCWVSYPEQVRLMGGVPVFIPTDESSEFLPPYDSLRAAITPRTKAIVLNTPHNPTGTVYPPPNAERDCLPRPYAQPLDYRGRDLRGVALRRAAP